MDDKPDSQFDRSPQRIRWLSCREVEGELSAAPRRSIECSPASSPAVAPFPILAHHCDALTGLPTLGQVSGIISRQIASFDRRQKIAALVAFDLDGFRSLCEEYGRAIGDEIIKEAAAIVASVGCPNAVIVRHGEDGFTVFLAELTSAADAVVRVQQVLDAIAAPREVGGVIRRITASAGVAMFPKDGENFDTLSRNARFAMRESKAKCPGALRFHSGSVAAIVQHRARLENDLRRSIENNELALFYQPQFEIRRGLPCGVEVLARWFRADGVVEPGVFIPLAEQTQLIEALGSWVLLEACTNVQRWRLPGATSLKVCVNVSPYQLNEGFPAVIQRVLELTGLPAERLELEITESALIGYAADIIQCFRELKALGVRIAIDDFGTGYSSLSYLSRLPVDRLKLDKSLIHNLTTQWKDVAILRAIIGLGKELGIEVIAEGVETEHQLQILKQLGCPQAQGYLLARPAPDIEARGMLNRRWGARTIPRSVARTVEKALHVS